MPFRSPLANLPLPSFQQATIIGKSSTTAIGSDAASTVSGQTTSNDDTKDALREPDEALALETAPFEGDISFSEEEASLLRQLVAKHPQRYSRAAIQQHFTKLELTGRQVRRLSVLLLAVPSLTPFHVNSMSSFSRSAPQIHSMGNTFCAFSNLHTLALTGNPLQDLLGKNLPASLRILQLAACHIRDLKPLLDGLPPLQHLGLALNLVWWRYFSRIRV